MHLIHELKTPPGVIDTALDLKVQEITFKAISKNMTRYTFIFSQVHLEWLDITVK